MALVVAALTVYANLPLTTLMNLGLVFLVVSNYGIADRRVHSIRRSSTANGWMGLSWVAVWTPLFTRGRADAAVKGAARDDRVGLVGAGRRRLDDRHRQTPLQSDADAVLLRDRVSRTC